MKTILTALILAVSFPALAAEKLGNEGANGGDEVALEFRQAFSSSVSRAKERLPGLYQKIEEAKLAAILEETQVLVVDKSLTVKRNGIYQVSIAINSQKPRQIVVNRTRWKELKDEIKEALALHEVASLAGLETTGKYPLSGEYLSLFMLAVDPQYDFTPACGRIETQLLRRAESQFEVGEVSRLEVTEAGAELQRTLRSCGMISQKQYCEVMPPMLDFIVEGIEWAVKEGMRGEFELKGAVWNRVHLKEYCSREYP